MKTTIIDESIRKEFEMFKGLQESIKRCRSLRTLRRVLSLLKKNALRDREFQESPAAMALLNMLRDLIKKRMRELKNERVIGQKCPI